MRRFAFTLAASILALAPLSAQSATTTLFFDDFVAEIGGTTSAFSRTRFSSFTQFNLVRGSVDLYANGGFGLPCGSAGCLDLDGSSRDSAGRLESKAAFDFKSGLTYEVIVDLAGKHTLFRNDDESLVFGVIGGETQSFFMPAGEDGQRTLVLSFIAGTDFTSSIFIDHAGADGLGLLLDSVTLTETTASVPLPASLPLALAGLAAFGIAGRRRTA